MLYCPRCQQIYEDAARTFCVDDDTRLLPMPDAADSFGQTEEFFDGFFTSDSFADAETADGDLFEIDRFELSLPETDGFFETEKFELAKVETVESAFMPVSETKFVETEATPVAASDAAQIDAGAPVGQVIEERYRITELVRKDESNAFYLAEDEIDDQTVSIRVLTGEDSKSYSTDRNFADERSALFLLNHASVAGILDWGAMPDGEPFLVTEHVVGESVKDILKRSGKFDSLRAARIVRTASHALTEAHANGILHRNLTPRNIILANGEDGAETVRLTNFSVSNGKFLKENLAYTSPEQVDGQDATAAGDVYSLAVIAFQMLTNRLPSDGASVSDTHAPPLEGLTLLLDNQRLDIELTIDEILEKALTFNPAARYQKAADFGDAFFNAVTKTPPWEAGVENAEDIEEIKIGEKQPDAIFAAEPEANPTTAVEPQVNPAAAVEPESNAAGSVGDASSAEDISPIENIQAEDIQKAEDESTAAAPISFVEVKSVVEDEKPVTKTEALTPEAAKIAELAPGIAALKKEIAKKAEPVKATQDLAWEKRSPPPTGAGRNWAVLGLLAAVVLASIAGLSYYAFRQPKQNETVRTTAPVVNNAPPATENVNSQTASPTANQNQALPAAPVASASTTADAVYFENSKDALKSEAARNFLGFSLYYPKEWKQNDAKNNFLDISKNAPTGTPVEQFLVSYYDSKGTFEADEKVFPALVKDTSKTLKSFVPNFKTIGKGAPTVVNGLRAYEVKFGGAGKTAKGENIKLWGKRLFVPAAREGTKNGYVLTLLATSLSNEVKNIGEVGSKGDLQTVLESFAPKQD